MPKDYSHFSKEELLELVEKQEAELRSKKYGLVWDGEREPEQVVLDCENNVPVLKRAKGKEIRMCDDGHNMLIEGDNYHALTVLNYTHKEKIDVIYIDPPYNTGNKDFVYNDRYVDKEDGYRHSKWLNFMEKRLNLAHRLLKKTGVIFISIDDNEVAQLKLLCDRIFGEENFVANFIWEHRKSSQNDIAVSLSHNYTLCYSKNVNHLRLNRIEHDFSKFSNPDNDPRGDWVADPFDAPHVRANLSYEIVNPNTGQSFFPPKGRHWRMSKEKFEEALRDNRIIWGRSGKTKPQYKRFRSEAEVKGVSIFTIWQDVDTTTQGTKDLMKVFGGEVVFNNPKPIKLVQKVVKISAGKNATILDFMAGSGTTGHAVLDLNKEDGGSRKFILCTNNELNGLAQELREKGLSEREMQEYGICRRVTYPRLEKVMRGYTNAKGEKVEGLGGNLQYLRTALVKKTSNRDQVRLNLTRECTEMLCVKENIFNTEVEHDDYKIFSSNTKDAFLCVYYNFLDDSFDEFVKELKKLSGKKIVYMFSPDGKVAKGLFSGIDGCVVEEIPQKILDIYKQLVKMNIPVKADAIISDFSKARVLIFDEKKKDEGARILRIVLEKTMQKISQSRGMDILKKNDREERAAILNDRLKGEGIFSLVEWEENKTYLSIGNHAAHGEYSEYDLKQVEGFYRHIQTLISRFI